MIKFSKILAAAMCVMMISSDSSYALAQSTSAEFDMSGVVSVAEFLLSQAAADDVRVSLRVDGKAETSGELEALGEMLTDQISQLLAGNDKKESYEVCQYPYMEDGFWLGYWYSESLTSCMGCALTPTEGSLTAELFLYSYDENSID